ncbi:phosphotransferase [Streptomyces sp. RKCA744]|uniref:phosphotransferase n=1 Tax=Streptomyces sp. RKCA744 TaxID=2959340 RepID=UPI00209CFC07|nr:phosphotransferase [Streptomyces sp. RKCA744]MCO8301431.1 aminoglycoside phosphotransferase family protein [Streptomyces sp. RKCA744]
MQKLPEEFDEARLWDALRGFSVPPSSVSYAPVGFGDYHWQVIDEDGRPWFATVSDLEHKEYCGRGAAAALEGLRRAMETARTLRERDGLRFVVAPVPAADGRTVVALDARYALAVFPHVPGRPGRFGQRLSEAERDQVLELLADLHGRTPPETTPPTTLEPAGLSGVHEALGELDGVWSGGPFAEPARELLAEHAATLRARCAEFAELTDEVRRRGAPLVVTHGEPHPGNLILGEDGYRLVDWDTVGLAPPERDLSLISADPSELARYTELTGRTPDPAGLALYRLRWSLLDVAEFVEWFRGEHDRSEDTETAWKGFTETLGQLADGASGVAARPGE